MGGIKTSIETYFIPQVFQKCWGFILDFEMHLTLKVQVILGEVLSVTICTQILMCIYNLTSAKINTVQAIRYWFAR